MFQAFLRLCCDWSSFAPETGCVWGFVGSASFLSLLLGKSNPPPVPGVFGVFACPKEANAPVPKPNAVEPGDLADAGEAVLKGFDLPCDDRPPNARGESSLPLSFVSGSLVGKESLSLVLKEHQHIPRTIAEQIAYFDLLVHKFA